MKMENGKLKTYKLRELLEIKNGRDHKKLKDGIYPVYGSGGIMRYVDSFLYDKPSVLLPRKGTLDNIQYADRAFWTVDTIYYTEVNSEKVNAYYLYNYLKLLDLSNLDSGTGVPSMTFDSYYNLNVKLPPLPTQQKIAAVLSALDDKIALNRRINAKLEQMAKRLYDYWFVQFDFPFDFAQGKPNADGKPYKASGGKMVWNETLKREIPAGWEVGNLVENRLTEIIKPGIAKFLKKKNYLATANIVGSDITDGLWIEFENRESRANMQPIYNSVWFAKMKNSIKHLSITNSDTWVLDKYILSTGFLGLKCSRESFAYIHSFINYSSFEGIKDTLAHGATQQAVNNEDLKSIPLLIPSKNVLVSYSNIVLPMIQKMNGLQQMNAKLTALRDRLLPLLMNGQVEVE